MDFGDRAARTAVQNVAEYLAHERRDLVPRAEGRQLLDGIDALRDDVDRFEARLQHLAQRLSRTTAVRLHVFVRLVRIQRVLLRHRLDELVRATHLYRPLRLLLLLSPGIWAARRRAGAPR